MNAVTKNQAYRDLAGTICACSGPKPAMLPLCVPCFGRLPAVLREALYRPGNFEEKYQAALDELHLTSVAVREDRDPLVTAPPASELEMVVR